MSATLREGSIQHPRGSWYVSVRPEYVAICTSDDVKGKKVIECAAAIMSVFEHWHDVKVENRKIKAGNATEDDLWIYMSNAQLRSRLLDMYGKNTIAKALKLIEDKGYVQSRTNPTVGWDRTLQYKFIAPAVQKAINTWKKSRRADISPKREMHFPPEGDPFPSRGQAIPYSTTNSTTELESSSAIATEDSTQPAKVSPSKKPRSTRKPWSDLTDALHNATPPDIRSSRPHYAAANTPAKALYEAGFTAVQVKAFAEENYPGYRKWAEDNGKSPVMSMHHVERKIRGWKPKPVYDPDPYTYVEYEEDGIIVKLISGRKEACNAA